MSSSAAAEHPGADDSANSARTSGAIPRDVALVIAVLVFTAFVMMLNETTLSVALPAIMDSYGIGATTAQWLLTGFMLTMAVVLPTTGWLLDRFRTRANFLFAIGIFLAGTVIAAVAPAFWVLLAARVAQAVGTAVIMPLLMTVAMTLVPAGRRGAVMGLISVVMAVGPAVGPSVGGLILSFADWHMIFWVMVPLVAIAGVIGAFKLGNISELRDTPLDVLSVILSALAFGGLVYALSAFAGGGTAARNAAIVLAVGVIGLVLFVWRQLALGRRDRALLDLRPLRNRNFAAATLALLGLLAAMLGVLNTLPLYLQGSLLVTALVSGLVLLPGGLLEGLLSPVSGILYDRFGPRPLVVPGMLLVVATLFWLATIDENTSVWQVVVIHVLFSVGLAFLFTPLMTAGLGALPNALYSHGSAILNTLQQLGGAAGTSLLIAVYSGVSASAMAEGVAEPAALADGAGSAFLVAAFIAVFALICTLFVGRAPDADRVTTLAQEEPV